MMGRHLSATMMVSVSDAVVGGVYVGVDCPLLGGFWEGETVELGVVVSEGGSRMGTSVGGSGLSKQAVTEHNKNKRGAKVFMIHRGRV